MLLISNDKEGNLMKPCKIIHIQVAICACLAAVLTACGGGSGDTAATGKQGIAAAIESTRFSIATALSTNSEGSAFQFVAREGENFSVNGTRTVRFGAGTNWVEKLVSGGGQCTNSFFGSDPAFGVFKSCEVTANQTVALEGEDFFIRGTQTVRFGAGTSWVEKLVSGGGQCTNDYFGRDPAFGVFKSCEVIAVSAPVTAWVRLALEGDSFTTTGVQTVRYGDGSRWIIKAVSGEASCGKSTFGYDPDIAYSKFCEVQLTVPNVVQTGTFPVVNTALIPKAAQPSNSAQVRTLSDVDLAHPVYQPSPSDIGAFREACNFSHMAADDPIVYPGQPGASHMHTFFGNSQLTAFSTADSVMNEGGSTCAGGTLNRTGYWIPTLIDTRTGQPIVAHGSNFYYKQGYLGVKSGTMQVFPKGLRMIAGDSASTTPNDRGQVRIDCSSGGGSYVSMPNCAVGDLLFMSIIFPQCWDGINLDSPNHKSHMAYATGNGCPSTHPVPLPEIAMNVTYLVTEANSGAFWRLSSDKNALPGGYSLHADWFNGWDATINKDFLAGCVNKNTDCHNHLLGDGRTLY